MSVASPSFPAANKCSFAIIVASERILDTQCSLQTRKCHADPTTAAASPLGPATRTLPPPTLRQRDFPSPLNKLYKEPIEELTSGKPPSNAVSSIDRRSARIMGSALAAKLTVPSHSGFSVLPPPPRYPGVGGYGVGGLGGIVPLVETNNTIEKPTGPEWQFLVGEGEHSNLCAGGWWTTSIDHTCRYLRSQRRPLFGYTSSTPFRSSHREPEPASDQPTACQLGNKNVPCQSSPQTAAIRIWRSRSFVP